jgi:S1-C subfamily serine protease
MESDSVNLMIRRSILFSLGLLALSAWRVCDSASGPWLSGNLDEQVLPGRLVQESQTRTSYRMRYVPPSRSPNQRTDGTMLKTFELAVGENWKSTVQVMSDRHQLALGIVVDKEGWIVTKASQLAKNAIEIRCFDGRKASAKVSNINSEHDLALLKAERSDLSPVQWAAQDSASVGSWLATTSTNKTPIGIGVVSVGPRAIPAARAVLGIQLDDADQGALVSVVVPGGGAYRAGIEEGDVIISLDGTLLPDKSALLQKIASLKAGQRVSVGLTRENRAITLDAQLMDLPITLYDEMEYEVNGSISARATGFSRVFQHDTVLAPHQCGGPLVDTHGRVVGINIARAGRVNSYALPLEVAIPTIGEMLLVAKNAK